MKFKFKKLLKYIIITFLIGSFFAIFINNSDIYTELNKPLDVPSIVFPIVWTILYLLMAISLYIISESNSSLKNKAIKSYVSQLIVNSFWTLFFFGFRLYTFSFIWLLLLIVLVVIMIINFYRINKIAGLINIPYFLWLLFAAYLNYNIIILN